MSLSELDFDYVRRLVRQHSAIQLEDSKSYLAEARLDRLARHEGMRSSQELLSRLRADGSSHLRERVIQAMTTNETLFFRDNYPFEYLQRTLIPELMQKNSMSKRLTIWSAACSSGQEPYSIGMLLHRHFPSLGGWEVRIIATDLSREVLERAMTGRFTQLEVNRGLPVDYLVRYFQRDGLEWQIKDEIRSMMVFSQMNLIGNWPPMPPLDIVFLRNVMIYFDIDTKRTMLARMARSIRPGGHLVLGGSESVISLDSTFESVPGVNGIYRNVRPAPSSLSSPSPSQRPTGHFRLDRPHE